jgi:hypothetical protein
MQWVLSLKLVALLTVANGIPAIASRLFGEHFNQPLDGGIAFVDKHPIFGPSKTIRGIILSLVAATAFAPLLGLDWISGLCVGGVAMLGDLGSSFLKRRLNMPPSSRATGVDQISGMFASDFGNPFNPWARCLRHYFCRGCFLLGAHRAFTAVFQMENKKSSILTVLTT